MAVWPTIIPVPAIPMHITSSSVLSPPNVPRSKPVPAIRSKQGDANGMRVAIRRDVTKPDNYAKIVDVPRLCPGSARVVAEVIDPEISEPESHVR